MNSSKILRCFFISDLGKVAVWMGISGGIWKTNLGTKNFNQSCFFLSF